MRDIKSTLMAGVAVCAMAASVTGSYAQNGGVSAPDGMSAGDWWSLNRDLAATRYSPLTEIDTENVSELQEAWTYQLRGFSQATPLVIDGIVYAPNGNGVVALDGDSGEEIWKFTLEKKQVSNRGVGYWPGDGEYAPRILFTSGSRLMAINAETGELATGFGDGGSVTIDPGYNGVPTVYRDVVIIGANVLELPQGDPGNPRGFDARTGRKLWEFDTVPDPGEPFHETWIDGWENRSGANMWAFSAPVDAERGIAYLPVSSPAPNYWGGGRPGDNVFGNSIVAVDAQTGEYRWHFQTVHHDLWDSDMPSAGGLLEVERNGREVPVIAHIGKTSWMYVLNRENGTPFHEVEERPVPKGDVPGEWYSPTQPIPARPEPLSPVSFSEEDLVTAEDTTAAHAKACRDYMERSGGFYNEGPFTPFLFHAEGEPPRSTIQFPGGTGGVNWGGVAVDPEKKYVFANVLNTSLVGWVEKKPPDVTYSFEAKGSKQPYDRASIDGVGPFHTFAAPISGEYDEDGEPVGPTAPCYKPPWARLVAVDAESGEIAWAVPLGLRTSLPEGKQLVGNAGHSGPTATAGGLVFVGATRDQRFRAFDSETGEELWQAKLTGNAETNPMSYQGQSGKQYVAVIALNRLMVYALP